MTIAETLHDFDPDPTAPWPPTSCPPWCHGGHVDEMFVADRCHFGAGSTVKLSIPYSEGPVQEIEVTARQAEGREPVVELAVVDRTILLTPDEGMELARALTKALDGVISAIEPQTFGAGAVAESRQYISKMRGEADRLVIDVGGADARRRAKGLRISATKWERRLEDVERVCKELGPTAS